MTLPCKARPASLLPNFVFSKKDMIMVIEYLSKSDIKPKIEKSQNLYKIVKIVEECIKENLITYNTGVDFLNWLKKGEEFRLFLSGLTFAVERHIQAFPHTGLRLTKKNRERR